jgi:hypothetical protein
MLGIMAVGKGDGTEEETAYVNHNQLPRYYVRRQFPGNNMFLLCARADIV